MWRKTVTMLSMVCWWMTLHVSCEALCFSLVSTLSLRGLAEVLEQKYLKHETEITWLVKMVIICGMRMTSSGTPVTYRICCCFFGIKTDVWTEFLGEFGLNQTPVITVVQLRCQCFQIPNYRLYLKRNRKLKLCTNACLCVLVAC